MIRDARDTKEGRVHVITGNTVHELMRKTCKKSGGHRKLEVVIQKMIKVFFRDRREKAY